MTFRSDRCENCRWWDNSTSLAAEPESGICRRKIPKLRRSGMAKWLFTLDTDWCRKFQPTPTDDETGPRADG